MNVGDLFDSPWKIMIIAVVLLVLFGSTKLPVFARSLGRSMRILKSEVSKSHDDEDEAPEGFAMAKPQALVSPQQQQIEQLQHQIDQLQQQQQQRTNQPG
jgi:sec-independent protein translocase protein TatA